MSAPFTAEPHFRSSETVSDLILGLADGLTVPFALAAGLSGASTSTHIVIIAGVSEIAAGAISMGLGGYLSARNDVEHYDAERQREIRETMEKPEAEEQEVDRILQSFGLDEESSRTVVGRLRQTRDAWVDFMMRFELGLERPNPRRAPIGAATIAAGYVVGGFIPLAPYFAVSPVERAVLYSVAVTAAALALFGYGRARVIGAPRLRSTLQTILLGGLAAAAAFAIARYIA